MNNDGFTDWLKKYQDSMNSMGNMSTTPMISDPMSAAPVQPTQTAESFDQAWEGKYGADGSQIPGKVPASMPLTVSDGGFGGGEMYNPELGDVVGWDPDGNLMTTKTHPWLKGLVRNDTVYSGGGGGQ